MKILAEFPRLRRSLIAVDAGVTKTPPGWEASVVFGWVGRDGHGHLLVWGWGWDEDTPLRPWPTVDRGPTPDGNRSACLAWCGLFVQVCRTSAPVSEMIRTGRQR